MPAVQRAEAARVLDQRVGVAALREARARHKLAVAARFDDHGPPAFFADLIRGDVLDLDALALHVLLGLLQALFKALVKVVDGLDPVRLTGFDNVELFLHVSAEFHVDDVGELLHHDRVDGLAERGGFQLLLVLLHIAAVHDGRDDGRIGGRASDAVFLQRVDQRGLGVKRRRLGELLVRRQLFEFEGLALLQRGQGGLLLFGVVGGFLVQRGEAVERDAEARRTEQVVPCRDGRGDGVLNAVGHLAGHKAAPDQAVELCGVAADALLDLVGGQLGHRRADGLVGVLRGGGGAAFPLAGGLADVVVAPALRNKGLGRGLSLGGNAQRVGTHIGDKTHRAVARNVHAFIQRLGGAHRAGGREAERAARVLLQGGRDEGRRGLAAALALFDLRDGVVPAVQRGQDAVGPLLIGDGQLFAVGGGGQAGRELTLLALRVQQRVDVPVFVWLEVFNFQLTVPDQPHGHALHAACGQAAADLFPQERAQFVADQTIQLAPGLLGVEQVDIDGARVGHALLDALLRDLVKGHAVGCAGVQPQNVRQMPADGLALAVRVGCQQDAVALFGLGLQLLDELLLALDGDIFRCIAIFDINAQRAGGQVAHMAHTGRDLVAAAQILANGLGLGRGFHDD